VERPDAGIGEISTEATDVPRDNGISASQALCAADVLTMQEVRDVEGGYNFRLRLCFSLAAPQVFFAEHAEHLAVKFRSFISMPFKAIRG
jgi:hypothetical protein